MTFVPYGHANSITPEDGETCVCVCVFDRVFLDLPDAVFHEC